MGTIEGSAKGARHQNTIDLNAARKFVELQNQGCTQAQIADQFGVGQSTVSRAIKVLEVLPPGALAWLDRGVTMFAAYELIRLQKRDPAALVAYIDKGGEGLAFADGKALNHAAIHRNVSALLSPKARQVQTRQPSPYAPDPARAAERIEVETAQAQVIEELIAAYAGRQQTPPGMSEGAISLLAQAVGLEKDFTYTRVIEQSLRVASRRYEKGASRIDPLRLFDQIFTSEKYHNKITTAGSQRWIKLAARTVQVCDKCAAGERDERNFSAIYCTITQKPDGEPDAVIYRCEEHLVGVKAVEKKDISAPSGYSVMYGAGFSRVAHFVKDGANFAACGQDKRMMIDTPKASFDYRACPICAINAAPVEAVIHG